MDAQKIFNDLENAVGENIRVEQGDYQVDGLWYCHKCNTPKQCRVEFLGIIREPFCLCKCGKEQFDEEIRQSKSVELELEYKHQRRNGLTDFELLCWIDRNNKVKSKVLEKERLALLKKLCFSEQHMCDWTFANANNCKAIEIARNYVDNFDTMTENRKGILFFGKTGRGKSFAGACIANALTDKGIPCLMTNFATIRDTAQGIFEGREEYFKSFNKFELLILDDLFAEGKTEFMKEIVYKVINARIEAGLPLIVTSNLTSEEIKSPADITSQRVLSRLYQMCIPYEVEGKDLRREQLKADFAEHKTLLGI